MSITNTNKRVDNLSTNIVDGKADNLSISTNTTDIGKRANNLGRDTSTADIDKRAENLNTGTGVVDRKTDNLGISISNTDANKKVNRYTVTNNKAYVSFFSLYKTFFILIFFLN